MEKKILKEKNDLIGIVLAGGMSKRMKEDKSLISYFNQAQAEYVADLLYSFCDFVFISCRKAQKNNFNKKYNLIFDTFENIGPLGAIFSSLEKVQKSILIVACDMPLLQEKNIQELINYRDENKYGTLYFNLDNNKYEPLFAIYEYKIKEKVLKNIQEEKYSIQKIINKNDFYIIPSLKNVFLKNINTPEEKNKYLDEN